MLHAAFNKKPQLEVLYEGLHMTKVHVAPGTTITFSFIPSSHNYQPAVHQ